jgi:tetratricopeptide (TPR) repeat protein
MNSLGSHIRCVLVVGAIISMIGCSSVGGSGAQKNWSSIDDDSKIKAVLTPKKNISQELLKQGVIYLREGNYQDAQKVFSAAIKVNPNNSTNHVLNGISYHLEYLNGSPDSKALAETAYGLANTLDKLDPLPLIQLGRLHMESADYPRAGKEFISAYALSPTDQDALAGLLQASLLQKDFKTALWAGDNLKLLKISSADNQRLLVLMYSAVGQTVEANKHLVVYTKLKENDSKAIESLKRQVQFIEEQRIAFASTKDNLAPVNINMAKADINASSQSPKILKVATAPARPPKTTNPAALAEGMAVEQQNSTDSSSTSSGSTTSSAPIPPPAASAGAPATSGGGGGGTYSAVSMKNQTDRWFDCDTRPGLGKAPGGSYGVPVGGTSGDQTLYLEPLPNPCPNNPPRMASIDAVLIRTVDVQGSSFGINLLTGLQIFAGSQRSSTTTTIGGVSGTLNTNASVLGIGNATTATLNGVSGLLNYTLNIANSITSNTQVVARPTLTALDRIPSTFYSGGVQTVGLNGGGVSGAQVSNIPTGISLSVTPTFVDDETMMLAVKVSRSFINASSPIGGFNAGLSVAQHAVTSNVRIKYGETLILDGLTLRTFSKEQDGVPVLQDIPIIQYFFNQSQKQQYVENVLVMVTPRKLISNANDLKKMEEDFAKRESELTPQEKNVYDSIKSYQDLIKGMYPNINGTLAALQRDSSYFRQFKLAVMSDEQDSWVTQSKMSRFLNSVADTLYFTR